MKNLHDIAGFTQNNKKKTKYPYSIAANRLVSKHMSGLKTLPKAKALQMRQTRSMTRKTPAFVSWAPLTLTNLVLFYALLRILDCKMKFQRFIYQNISKKNFRISCQVTICNTSHYSLVLSSAGQKKALFSCPCCSHFHLQ